MIPLLIKIGLGGLNILKLIGGLLKRFFSALDVQGWVGLAASVTLAALLLHQVGESRHWKKQSGQFETLYLNEQTAFAKTVANYRAAAVKAQQEDAANKVRVEAEQAQINERTSNDYETRLAAARALAVRLRLQSEAAANPGAGGNASVPGIPAAVGGPAQAACDRLPDGSLVDAKLCATEQGIQLDELISWSLRQHAVDPNVKP